LITNTAIPKNYRMRASTELKSTFKKKCTKNPLFGLFQNCINLEQRSKTYLTTLIVLLLPKGDLEYIFPT